MKQPVAALANPRPNPRTSRLTIPCSLALSAGLLAGVAGCASNGGAPQPLAAAHQVVIEGRVASIDLSPMAHDGDALVVVASDAHGAVTVHLPARRHLCKAQGLDLLDTLQPGDRLQAAGEATGPADLRVCAEASHRLRRLD